jgi:hypothetical protein
MHASNFNGDTTYATVHIEYEHVKEIHCSVLYCMSEDIFILKTNRNKTWNNTTETHSISSSDFEFFRSNFSAEVGKVIWYYLLLLSNISCHQSLYTERIQVITAISLSLFFGRFIVCILFLLNKRTVYCADWSLEFQHKHYANYSVDDISPTCSFANLVETKRRSRREGISFM